MKIGIFDPYLDALGGGEKYMLTMAECLAKKHVVSVFWDSKEDVEKNVSRFSLDFSNVAIDKNIFSPSVSSIKRFLATRKYDIIIFLSDGSIPLVGSKKLYLHFQFPVEWVKNGAGTSLKMKKVSQVICNSRFTASYIDKKFHNSSTVLYPPVDTLRAAPATKKEKIILHVGRFAGISIEGDDYKKQQRMVEIFKKMVDSGLKDWQFVVAASLREQEEEKFQQMEESANGYPIRFVKNSDNKDLWQYYNKASIYWHASGLGEDLDKHPERAEHFGISTVEAMSAGAVPVVIKAGGQAEIVTDGVDGILWEDEETFITKTLAVIHDDGLRTRLSEKAIMRAKDFTKERFCEQIQKLVE